MLILPIVSVLLTLSCADARAEPPCARCGWIARTSERSVVVSDTSSLRRAIGEAKPGTSIELDDGTYELGGQTLNINCPDLVLRSRGGDRKSVVIRGGGFDDRLVAITIAAPRVEVRDLTIADVGLHGIQIRGENQASGVAIHNVVIRDTGEQLIKLSMRVGQAERCRDGWIACSRLEYTRSAPSDYTNGIDLLNVSGWTIRHNTLRRIRGPASIGGRAGPAILIWKSSEGTRVEFNHILESYRGIALGLQDRERSNEIDHRGGVIRRNVIINVTSACDEAIEANAAANVLIEHNTVYADSQVPWSISVRWPVSSAIVRNNLTNRRVVLRDGAHARTEGNVESAQRGWFVNLDHFDARLSRGNLPAVDAGVAATAENQNPDQPAHFGRAPDAGAYEFVPR